MARRKYREGLFGEFRLGTACLLEKWYYRHSNFQNWMTTENSDAFTYIGCHYVDLVHFITGLLPSAVVGVRHCRAVSQRARGLPVDRRARHLEQRRLPQRAERAGLPRRRTGHQYAGPDDVLQGRDRWRAAGAFRPVSRLAVLLHAHPAARAPRCTPSPAPTTSSTSTSAAPGLTPVGYGYRSIEAIISAAIAVEAGQTTLAEIDAAGIIATPANSAYNEKVIEAARESIQNGGREVRVG